ncbi:C6 transcription factor [Penicillium malachiteum]|uniref:C6 transcription factor n=1 Tax=Penicillium malachiteum TaxID=1324776 RepID=A0AAD6MWT4_9EURO|nr:C6 transcription factor [Penicillium malachiteum]
MNEGQLNHGLASASASVGLDGIAESASPSTTASMPSQGPLISNLPVFDMEIFHHYMISTCFTLSRTPIVQAIWRDEVPRVGFTMPAVLHATLAVSALHLASTDPSKRERCIAQAHMHHEIAVRTVTPNLPSLATDNGAGIFLFSSLTCIFACASAGSENNFLVLFEHGRLANWILLFRGTKTVLDFSSDDFSKGKLGPMFIIGSRSAAAQDSNAMEQGQMYTWELKQLICRDFSHDPRLRHVYEEALDKLSRTLGIVLKPGEGPRLQTADIFPWLLEVSDEYLDLLVQEAPVALIIFGYFCVALHQIEWMWWMEGLCGRLMSQLHSVVDEKYRYWLRWPQEQIGWSPESTNST